MKTPFRFCYSLVLFLLLNLFGFNILTASNPESEVDLMLKKAYEHHQRGIHYYRIKNPTLEIENYDKALQLRLKVYEDHGITRDSVLEGIIKGYFNIADSWKSLGNLEKMGIYLDSCWDAHLRFEEYFGFYSHRRRGQYYHLQGQLYSDIASWEPTMEAYLNAATHFNLTVSKSDVWKQFQQAKIHNDISSLFIKWGMAADSVLVYGKRALKVYQSLEGSGFLVKQEIAIVKTNLGLGYEMKGALDDAEQSFKEALQILNELRLSLEQDIEPLVEDMNNAYNGLGITLTASGKFEEARTVLNQAIELIQRLRDLQGPDYLLPSQLLASCYNNLAEVYFKMGNYTKALEENQKALALIVKNFDSLQDEYGNPNINSPDLFIYEDLLFLTVISDKTRFLRALGRQQAAITTADLGINYIYKIRSNYQDFSSRFSLADYIKILTEELLSIYLQGENPDIDKAFYYAERSKIYTLLEAVKDHKTLKVAGVDENLLAQEKMLRREIDQLKVQIAKSSSQNEKVDQLAALAQKRAALSLVLSTLQENPNYQRLFVGMEPVGISFIQSQLLAGDQALLEYFTGRQGAYVFFIPKKGQVRFYHIPVPEEQLEKDVDDFLTAIFYSYQDEYKYESGLPQQFSRDQLQQQWLTKGQELFGTCLAKIQDDYPTGRLLIVPDGPLNKLPFSALIRPSSQIIPGAYHSYPFAGINYDIGYCYAATLLAEMQQPLSHSSGDLLAFAPSFSGKHADQKSGFSHLTYNEIEVDEICQTYACSTQPLVGAEALKQTFLELIQENPYHIIHLSTHGKANYAEPDNSFISFSQLQKGIVDKEQLFYLRELYNMEIAVEMVVLSSCETNVGLNHRAGGMLSLTRGFAFAGANSIVSSLWSVDDKATKELMTLFYQNLKSGMSKDRSLQEAKNSLRLDGNFSHPYYWAAFIPVGKMHEQAENNISQWFLFAAGLLLLLAFIWRRKLFPRFQ